MTFKNLATLTALTALLIPVASALSTPAAPASVDTNAEKAAWEALMAPEGEYAAIAAYTAVVQKFGPVEPYASILRSEDNHAQALTRQLQRSGVAVPANPYLGKVAAPATLKAAAQQEAQTEVANVALYDRLFALAAGDAPLTRVFTNLRTASQTMHLPMFTKAAAGDGTLSAADMAALHSQHMNSLGQNGLGQGNGPGRGRGLNAQKPGQGMGYAAQPGTGYGQGQMHAQPGRGHPGTGRGGRW